MTEMPSHDAKPAQIPDALEGQVYRLMAAARAALDVATEALAMADERRSDILPVGGDLKIEGRRFEALRDGSRARRGVIGAYAFLSNLVIVEKCLAGFLRLDGFPPDQRRRANRALEEIRTVVDRSLRNTAEHIDERVIEMEALVVSTFVEGDLFCSSRRDGSIGAIAVNLSTLEVVTRAFYGIFWSEAVVDRIIKTARTGKSAAERSG